jgi:RNA polymerase sigma-70 factor (ECF subfamily)
MSLVCEQTSTEKKELIRLVRAAQHGDPQAFGQLFGRYGRAVYAAALRRLANHAEAQEVVQDVFIQAMRKIGQLRNPVCFGGWLRSIANRMAINRAVRGGHKIAASDACLEARFVQRKTPLGEVLDREEIDQLHVGLKRLTALDRDTLVAFYFRGRSLIQMSDEFQSPVGTIKRRLHVARKRLAKHLQTLALA